MRQFRQFNLSLLLLFSALMMTLPAYAEQKAQLGKWDVHYMVVNTTFLSSEVAKKYEIVRSKYNALVNVSVLDSETQEAQNVSLTGTATNLLGNVRSLTFKKVEEGDAIYYLAPLSFDDRETFRFNLTINHGNDSETLTFKQEMFVD